MIAGTRKPPSRAVPLPPANGLKPDVAEAFIARGRARRAIGTLFDLRLQLFASAKIREMTLLVPFSRGGRRRLSQDRAGWIAEFWQGGLPMASALYSSGQQQLWIFDFSTGSIKWTLKESADSARLAFG